MNTNEQQVKEILDPILDLMSGADGGVAFAKLRHAFLPAWIEMSANDPSALELMKAFELVSNACRVAMASPVKIDL